MTKRIEDRAVEYAESYINGNITWVMDQLKKTRKRASLVLHMMQHLQAYDESSEGRRQSSGYAKSFARNLEERSL